MSKENTAYTELCAIRDELCTGITDPDFYTAAMIEACRRRPDLAAAAIGPTGRPLRERPEIAPIVSPPVVKAAEALAEEMRGRK